MKGSERCTKSALLWHECSRGCMSARNVPSGSKTMNLLVCGPSQVPLRGSWGLPTHSSRGSRDSRGWASVGSPVSCSYAMQKSWRYTWFAIVYTGVSLNSKHAEGRRHLKLFFLANHDKFIASLVGEGSIFKRWMRRRSEARDSTHAPCLRVETHPSQVTGL